jgi:hypothetical protein
MTRERHLLGHLIFQTNEGDVAVASKQIFFVYSFQFIPWKTALQGNYFAT